MSLIPGYATAEGTAAFGVRTQAASGAYTTKLDGLSLSSVGIGTYLGEVSDETDAAYASSLSEALGRGINVIDTASIYRSRRSEKVIGQVLKHAIANGVIRREQVFVASKAGYLEVDPTFHGPWIADLQRDFVGPGVLEWGDIANGTHCLRPSFIEREFELSRQALGLETIDLYYLHNPEEQLQSVDRKVAMSRIGTAFQTLERFCSEGKLRCYGVATWEGLRAPPSNPYVHLSIEELVSVARAAAGDSHHLRAVQMPLSVEMPEAATDLAQMLRGAALTPVKAADELKLYVFASKTLDSGALNFEFPDAFYDSTLDLVTDHQRQLQFVRSLPGVGTALFGTKRRARAREGALVLMVPKLTPDQLALVIPEDGQ